MKQKLPFLYKHFDQIIFFDLNIKTFKFSTDGGHEYIKNFPDPENKITLIEQTDLSEIKKFEGQSFEEKCKMFAAGSKLVRNDMDVFWCTDMDEFFDEGIIRKVEASFNDKEKKVNTIVIPHVIYFYDHHFILANPKGIDTHPFPFARITRHVPGRIYGHCTLQKHTPVHVLKHQVLHHFAFVGDKRMRFKMGIYEKKGWYNKVWKSFNPKDIPDKGVHGRWHPALDLGVKRSKYKIPDYINVKEMMKDLGM